MEKYNLNNQLVSIISLLGLNYYEDNDKVFIIDQENEDATTIERYNDGKYGFSIGDVSCIFNQSFISISKGNIILNIVGGNISYKHKEEKADDNKASYSFINNISSFYYTGDDTLYDLAIFYGDDAKYEGMKNSSIVKDPLGTTKKDVFSSVDNSTIRHIHIRYNNDGSMVGGTTFDEELIIPYEEYILQEIGTNPVIPSVFEDMNANIPGIVEYYSSINPSFKKIVNKNNITK